MKLLVEPVTSPQVIVLDQSSSGDAGLPLGQHDSTAKCGELTVRPREVRLDPGRLRGPDTPESAQSHRSNREHEVEAVMPTGRRGYTGKPVSDRGTLEDLPQSPIFTLQARTYVVDFKRGDVRVVD